MCISNRLSNEHVRKGHGSWHVTQITVMTFLCDLSMQLVLEWNSLYCFFYYHFYCKVLLKSHKYFQLVFFRATLKIHKNHHVQTCVYTTAASTAAHTLRPCPVSCVCVCVCVRDTLDRILKDAISQWSVTIMQENLQADVSAADEAGACGARPTAWRTPTGVWRGASCGAAHTTLHNATQCYTTLHNATHRLGGAPRLLEPRKLISCLSRGGDGEEGGGVLLIHITTLTGDFFPRLCGHMTRQGATKTPYCTKWIQVDVALSLCCGMRRKERDSKEAKGFGFRIYI